MLHAQTLSPMKPMGLSSQNDALGISNRVATPPIGVSHNDHSVEQTALAMQNIYISVCILTLFYHISITVIKYAATTVLRGCATNA